MINSPYFHIFICPPLRLLACRSVCVSACQPRTLRRACRCGTAFNSAKEPVCLLACLSASLARNQRAIRSFNKLSLWSYVHLSIEPYDFWYVCLSVRSSVQPTPSRTSQRNSVDFGQRPPRTARQTVRQAGRERDRETDRHRPTDGQMHSSHILHLADIHRQTDSQTGRQTEEQTDSTAKMNRQDYIVERKANFTL